MHKVGKRNNRKKSGLEYNQFKPHMRTYLMKIIFATENSNKLREAREILNMDIDSSSIEIDEIQAVDASKVAMEKAKRAYEILKKPLIVEDTGLYFKKFGNFPGALVKWMIKGMGRDNIAKYFHGLEATAECCVCFYDGKEMKIFSGSVEGHMAENARGESGFGWDPVFIPKGTGKTFAEMTPEEKHAISHRGKAFLELKKWLQEINNRN